MAGKVLQHDIVQFFSLRTIAWHPHTLLQLRTYIEEEFENLRSNLETVSRTCHLVIGRCHACVVFSKHHFEHLKWPLYVLNTRIFPCFGVFFVVQIGCKTYATTGTYILIHKGGQKSVCNLQTACKYAYADFTCIPFPTTHCLAIWIVGHKSVDMQ